jgi:hypothetical protein
MDFFFCYYSLLLGMVVVESVPDEITTRLGFVALYFLFLL